MERQQDTAQDRRRKADQAWREAAARDLGDAWSRTTSALVTICEWANATMNDVAKTLVDDGQGNPYAPELLEQDPLYAAAQAVHQCVALAEAAVRHASGQLDPPPPVLEELPADAEVPRGMTDAEFLRFVRTEDAADEIRPLGEYRALLRAEEVRVTEQLRAAIVAHLTARTLTWTRAAADARVSPDTLGRWMEQARTGPT